MFCEYPRTPCGVLLVCPSLLVGSKSIQAAAHTAFILLPVLMHPFEASDAWLVTPFSSVCLSGRGRREE